MVDAPCEELLSCGQLTARTLLERSDWVRVHGRLLALTDGRWILADASGKVSARAPEGVATPSIGSWVLLRGHPTAAGLSDTSVLSVSAGQFRPRGEFTRFTRIGANLAKLARARRLVRDYFDGFGFVEVTTPTRVASAGTDPFIEPYSAGDEWLITSPELHMKRLLVGGLSRIYQLVPCHRQEEHGAWHEPEFTMLEWYRAFEDVESVMADTEAVVCELVEVLASDSRLIVGERSINVSAPFAQLSVREAFAEFADCNDVVDLAASDEQRYFELLVERVEPGLAGIDKPVFLTDYPSSHAALARRKPNDEAVAERFELYLGGVEVCNGYGELTDPVEQRRRFENEQSIRSRRHLRQVPIDEEFLGALVEGLPPSAGNALGFERLVALALGVPLQDVVAFPAGSRDSG